MRKTMMRPFFRFGSLGLALLLVAGLAAPTANATVITTGCVSSFQCTFDELTAGGTIQVDDKIFDTWSVDFSSPGQVATFDGSDLFAAGTSGPAGNPAIVIAGSGVNAFDGIAFLLVSYEVSVAPGVNLAIDGVSMTLQGVGFDPTDDHGGIGGVVSIVKRIQDASTMEFIIGGNQFEVFALQINPQNNVISDARSFSPLQNIIVTDQFNFRNASFVQLRQEFNQVSVPEPTSITLLGLGLVGLGFVRRRKNIFL